jgi:hypothetical protein
VRDIYGWKTEVNQHIPFAIKEGRLFFPNDGLFFQQFYDQITLPLAITEPVIIDCVSIVFGIEGERGEDFLRFAKIEEISDSSFNFFQHTYIEIDSAIDTYYTQVGNLEYQLADQWTRGHFKFVKTSL